MNVTVTGTPAIDQAEIYEYERRASDKYGARCTALDIHVDGDEVELKYHVQNPPFERIRRITGYLVGAMPRWNDAKRAEERDRVKHAT